MNVATHDASASALSLMDHVLREGGSVALEFPLVFDPRFEGRVVTVEDDAGEVLSACAILPRELILRRARIPVGLVGSVVTDPDHRRQGLAGRVLDRAERELASQGCMLSMLWADDPDFYFGRGYTPIGTEIDFPVPRQLAELLPDSAGVRDARPDDHEAMHELYATNPERVTRAPVETGALLSAPGIESLVLEREGELDAYSCLGRGADLRDAVHEWAGGAEDVLACLRGHLERREQGLFLMSPPSAMTLRSFFERVLCPGEPGVLGMGKLLDAQAARELLTLFTDGAGRVAQVAGDTPGLRIGGPGGTLELTGAEVLNLLFTPKGERDVVEYVEQRTGIELRGLPLAPFVWGLDSI